MELLSLLMRIMLLTYINIHMQKKPLILKEGLMWALRDLNPGPIDYESTALTN